MFVAEPKRPSYAHLEPLCFEDDWGDIIEFVDYPAIAKDYCHKVISGEYPACRYIKMACKRYLKMLDMAKTGKYGFSFSEAHCCDFLGFLEELPLVEDNFRGVTHNELEPWQIWVGCALYGFRDARGFRYVQECYLEVPRKSAKSVFATGIALYDVRNPESRTPLVLIAASTLDQANRVFTPVRKTIEQDEELSGFYKLEATEKIIRCHSNSGTIEKVASIGERQDGWNPTTIILEELHAQNPDVYAVLKSALGSRGGQLLFQITTAGRNAFGLAWDNRKAAIKILEGHDANYKIFAAIYTLDKEDLEDDQGNKRTDHLFDSSAEPLWLKACPNLGVSFDLSVFHHLAAGARQKPQDREEFLRTRINIWTNAASKLFDIEQVRRGVRDTLKLEAFKGKKCWIGVDLSASEDLTAVAIIFEGENGEIILFVKFYMSGDSQLLSDPDYMAMVREWVDRDLISSTYEGGVDFNEVERDIRELCEWFDAQAIGFDPAMAGMMMKNLEDDRFPVVKYINRANMMTAPVDDLTTRAHTKTRSTLIYDGNPVLEWCFSNVHGERKKDGTILPFKDATDSLNKIDGMVAAAFANGLRLHPEYADKVKKPSIYEKRGLLGATHERNRSQQDPSRPPRYS